MRILLLGDYDQGNFGDDAMALLFARECVSLGHQVALAGARDTLVTEIGQVSTAPSLQQDAVRRFDAVVLGGGGILSRQPIHWRLRGTRRAANARFQVLADALEAAAVPTFALSIGGDGATDPAELTAARRRVVELDALRGVTLRLEADIPLFQGRPFPVVHVPDILYRLAGLLPGRRDDSSHDRGGPRVGVNIKRWQAPAILRAVRSHTPEQSLVAIRTHTSSSGHAYESVAGYQETLGFEQISTFVEDLAGLDLLVTSKLHAGLVALTLGVPVICARPPAKAALEMERLGLRNVANDAAELRQLLSMWRDGNVSALVPSPDRLRATVDAAGGHLAHLSAWLTSLPTR